uniref:Uncharacterized protein, isoform A n=2 Tax=Drosophila melanogaster TaxID=7227 RepID=Q9VVF8_DROME|nr:uncharacterized protein Dmel_CG7692, isoform A [Drosophila melanogaster]AAF49353.2 uncharacterized protein Dmel_CG7692, isoform A [Drosophila melanogaster]|eukprot:NP_648972.2 uncharacterized protein Dmel_CG7692, isoform A [Drosophila melanogaster]
MDLIFSQDVHDAEKFLDCAEKLEYDEFSAKMFVFCNAHSDVDVFELMGNDRLSQLIYGWEVCHLPTRDSESLKDPALRHMVRVLAHHSLLIWFSQEWKTCSEGLKQLLLYSLTKAVPSFYQIGELANFNWSYVLQFQTRPWSLPYLQQLFLNLKLNKHHAIEHPVPAASGEEVAFLIQEGISLALLRLIQLFNAGNFEAVKQLALRMLAAWVKAHENDQFVSFEGDKNSITLIGHLYLLTVFVRDENRGFVIDNLMYNIRFYTQIMQEASMLHDINFTPARLIAHVCVRLQLGKNGFFEQIGFRKFKFSLVTSFAVMLEVYASYVLGNLLMELQALNEHDFLEHLPQFKELMYRYVEERESSERFLLEELKKKENQRNSHFQPHVVELNLNYQQQICKGNRASNIGDYKNCDDDEQIQPEVDEEQDRQIDPVFQNVPNNEEVLSFVYKLLAERNFSGWTFAKIALLLKIIGQQLNAIEIWKYHPGLTVDFMLNLEQKMSENYADLAKVFSEHGFMEAEFWLTAFYLHPTSSNYNEVRRCSRIKKKRQEDDLLPATTPQNVKYELLSSTIDVDEIVKITNHYDPVADYDPIHKSLQALRLPRSMIQDLLTVVFQPRNKRYSWALDWHTLHERCHALLKSPDLKRKFVSLNMAEAGDDLKYLQIDYAKYRDRPQLDYGTIEEGYENAVNLPEAEEEAEQTSAVDDEAEKAKEQKKRRPAKRKFWDEVVFSEDEEEAASSDSEPYYTGNGRRTRVRAAAMVANAMLSDMDRSVRGGRRSSSPETSHHQFHTQPVVEEQPKIAVQPPKQLCLQETSARVEKRTISELMESRPKFTNETVGFKPIADIWSFKKEELQNVVEDSSSMIECSSILNKFKILKALKMAKAAKAAVQPCSQLVQNIVRTGSETESVNSETSTMATHDFNEEEVSEGSTGVSKELTPSPTTKSDLTMDPEVLQPTGETKTHLIHGSLETTKVPQKTPEFLFLTKEPVRTGQQTQEPLGDALKTSDLKQVIPNGLFKVEGLEARQAAEKPKQTGQPQRDLPNTRKQKDKLIHMQRLGNAQLPNEMSTPSETGTETDTAEETLLWDGSDENPKNKCLQFDSVNNESNSRSANDIKEMETNRQINECLTRSSQVCLTRLTPRDIEKLRGVRVRVKRTNMANFYNDQTRRSQRRLTASLNGQSRSHTEDSNGSSNSYNYRQYDRRRFKKFVHITSDSPAPSESSTPSPRMIAKPVFKHITSDSSTDLEEVTRSVSAIRRRGRDRGRSGPKCITEPNVRRSPSFQPDVIELSSDSLSSNSPIPAANPPMNNFTHAMDMDPLYEEAIIPF